MSENKKSPCPVAKKCGACQLSNMDYPRQLAWKQAKCEILLKKYCKVENIVGMDEPYHYRNKVQAAFGKTRGGKVISGVYQSKTGNIVALDSCMTEDECADRIIVDIRRMLPKFKLTVYDDVTGTGLLRHVLVRRGFTSGEVMVVLVTSSPAFKSKRSFVNELLRQHPEITTVVMNVNKTKTGLFLGEYEEFLHGKGYIEDTLCGCTFRISPKSFYQINPTQTEKLYSIAMEYACLKEDSRVLDAYCGIGTIGLVAAKSAGEVIGVELNADAVRDAKENAKLNGAKNARFYCADAGDFITEAASRDEKFDVIFMDPPRAGSTKKFIDALGVCAPERIVYVSCNPETLERDLRFIIKKGYAVTAITPVDMFPHTNHVEVVVCLSREKADDYIRISVHTKDLKVTKES